MVTRQRIFRLLIVAAVAVAAVLVYRSLGRYTWEEIEESLLAVPLRYGSQVVGVIVVSKLGLDQFDGDDLRLLEVLAAHAAVALVNAQLYEEQRREAEKEDDPRLARFVESRVGEQRLAIFSMNRLVRAPDFRQAAA